MKTLEVTMSDNEYKLYGIKKNKLTINDFLDLVNRKRLKEALENCVDSAEKSGLSNMTIEEIDEEIKAVRNVKNHP